MSSDTDKADVVKDLEADKDLDFVDEDAPISPERKKQLYLACGAILGNETCERMAYYGISTNITVYMKTELGYSAPQAASLRANWNATVYVTPLLGAFLADAYLGRYWVILIFSSIYLVGMAGLSIINIPSLPIAPQGADTTAATKNAFWAFMYLIAIGSGGIKPCVSSFGADQFEENSKAERAARSAFFNWFYFCINVGSLVAALVLVWVQTTYGYALGFAIPAIAFAVAIFVFVLGTKTYKRIPPAGSPFTRLGKVIWGSIVKISAPMPQDPSELYEVEGEKMACGTPKLPYTPYWKCVNKAAIEVPGKIKVTVSECEEFKAFMSIMPIFLTICIWQLCYDQVFNWTAIIGETLDTTTGGITIAASQISFANTVGVLVTVIFYDTILIPVLARFGWSISMTMRIGLGFIVLIMTMVYAAGMEIMRLNVIQENGLQDSTEQIPMSVWWQVPIYYLIGIAEVFTNVGTMELFYTQVSEGMRSLGTSFYLLSTGIGGYIGAAVIETLEEDTDWLPANLNVARLDLFFWLMAGIAGVDMIIYVIIAQFYKGKPRAVEDPFDKTGRLHSELANVSRTWPSVTNKNRALELATREKNNQPVPQIEGRSASSVAKMTQSQRTAALKAAGATPVEE